MFSGDSTTRSGLQSGTSGIPVGVRLVREDTSSRKGLAELALTPGEPTANIASMASSTSASAVERARQKDLGAYYTQPEVVDFLVRWGLSRVQGVVMDPSCGDGRFLTRAVLSGAKEVIGCDLSPEAASAARSALAASRVPAVVHESDFFALDPAQHPRVDLVVGNPPFIRFQRFNGDTRRRALQSALHIGVHLTALSSAWAPFVVHSIRFIRPGGALAMVVPAEVVQTNYGLKTLDALCRNFGRVHLLAFARNFFPDAQADAYLLLAEDAGSACRSAELHPLESVEQLADASLTQLPSTTLPVCESKRTPFALAFLELEERGAWERAVEHPGVTRLCDLGKITNGYVTGANDFFLTTREAALEQDLLEEWLVRSVANSASLRGTVFTAADVAELEAEGRPHHLVNPPVEPLFCGQRQRLDSLVRRGETLGIHKRFKCRTRDPWWHVPGVHVPHLFLPYMIGREPVASVNAAGASYTNTIHGIRLHRPGTGGALAIGLHSTLTLLSMELSGRTYGGGILKLEPSEMERVHVAVPEQAGAAAQVNRLIRTGDYSGAVAIADDVVLRKTLNLSRTDIGLLTAARNRLVSRRYSRNPRRSRK